MDKRTVLAFFLSFLIIMVYPYYLKQMSPPSPAPKGTLSQEELPKENINTKDIDKDIRPKKDNTSDLPLIAEDAEVILLENDNIVCKFSSFGAVLQELTYKRYKNDANKPYVIVARPENKSCFGLFSINGKDILRYEVVGKGKNFVRFKALFGEVSIIKEYKIDEYYGINLNIYFEGNTQIIENIETVFLLTYDSTRSYSKRFVNALVQLPTGKLITKNYGKLRKEPFTLKDFFNWVGIEEKYFAVLVKNSIGKGCMTFYLLGDGTSVACLIENDKVDITGNSVSYKVYAGPRDATWLKKYDREFKTLLSRGMLGGLRNLLLVSLKFFYRYTHNYGVAIILLTIAIKIILFPLTHKSFKSMKKMQELQPQMKHLQEKYKDDPQQLNKEMMELYRKHNANPLGGCLPLLLQMPILIAFYQMLSRSIELKGAYFIWWIKDLSAPDSVPGLPFSLNILPILMIISMIVQQKMTPSTASKEQQRAFMFMPIMFGIMFYNLPSGLVLYWLVNNVATILQQELIKRK